MSERQERLINNVFQGSAFEAKRLVDNYRELHSLAKIKINQQQQEIDQLKEQLALLQR